jgi:hypothetical protein
MNRATRIGIGSRILISAALLAMPLGLTGCYVNQAGQFAPWTGADCAIGNTNACRDLQHSDRDWSSELGSSGTPGTPSVGTPGPGPGPGPT